MSKKKLRFVEEKVKICGRKFSTLCIYLVYLKISKCEMVKELGWDDFAISFISKSYV